jgi:hypothetical protein
MEKRYSGERMTQNKTKEIKKEIESNKEMYERAVALHKQSRFRFWDNIKLLKSELKGINEENTRIRGMIEEMVIPIGLKELAEYLHNQYEIFSKQQGWETQKECRVKFDDLPEANKRVMCLVATSIIQRFQLLIQEYENKLLSKIQDKGGKE